MKDAISSINKKDITEFKIYAAPPDHIKLVLSAIAVLFGFKEDWADVKKNILGDMQLHKKLQGYDYECVAMKRIEYLQKNYIEHSDN